MYNTRHRITANIGNNTFSYDERKDIYGQASITIPRLHTIHTSQDIVLGDTVVFEEIDYTGNIHSCTGLQYIYHLDRAGLPPIYIFDNHNHALFFWTQWMTTTSSSDIHLLHIDQHSDLNTPGEHIDISRRHDSEYLRTYTNYTCNVGNFIVPFLDLYPSTQCTWIKSEEQLLTYMHEKTQKPLLLDIDLDFRAPDMQPDYQEQSIDKTKEIIKNSNLVTIATSPYFLDQTSALLLLHNLLT